MSATLSAHPRSRGEHLALPITAVSSVGSSPLARGTRSSCRSLSVSFRLIPARAGNTAEAGTAIVGWTAHPRSRGEHRRRRLLCALASGSSPLARGTRVHLFLYDLPRRLIPARAGNTFGLGSARPSLPAHPRSRGEHFARGSTRSNHLGSSPLARGTLYGINTCYAVFRLIPARAGNTGRRGRCASWSSAHPRSRGEHTSSAGMPDSEVGSSPLARGTHLTRGRAATRLRLIPARAGNTSPANSFRRAITAHPRSRGEHYAGVVAVFFGGGSSPLARGTQSRFFLGRFGLRLIPARAGNTASTRAL